MTLVVIVLVLGWLALPLIPALQELYRAQDAAPLVLGAHGLPGSVPHPVHKEGASTNAESAPSTSSQAAREATPGLEPLVVLDSRLETGPLRAQRLVLTKDCIAPGPLHAALEARLEPGATFRSLVAPHIVVDASQEAWARKLSVEPVPCRSSNHPSPNAVWKPIQGWWKAEGSVVLCDHHVLKGSLVCAGDVELGERSAVLGDVKATGRVQLAAGARVLGNIVAENVRLGRECHVAGNIVAEERVVLEPLVTVGSPTRLVTVLADDVELDARCVVHGAVTAHRKARVLD
jgi:cytoskeletal protein CcmA (bactofilin family)